MGTENRNMAQARTSPFPAYSEGEPIVVREGVTADEHFSRPETSAPHNLIDRRLYMSPVIEVLSRGTRRFDRTKKLEIYARNGVREAWFVDPGFETVIAFTGEGNGGPGRSQSPLATPSRRRLDKRRRGRTEARNGGGWRGTLESERRLEGRVRTLLRRQKGGPGAAI